MTCESEANVCARVGLTMKEFAETDSNAEYIFNELEVLKYCL